MVKAARDAGVIIHALGFTAEAADLPKFQTIRRLAEDTGGLRREVRVGGTQKYTVGNQFAAEALENGGTARDDAEGAAGPVTVSITADFTAGRSETIDRSLTLAAPAQRSDLASTDGASGWRRPGRASHGACPLA